MMLGDDPLRDSADWTEVNRKLDHQIARAVQIEAENTFLRAQLEAFHNAASSGTPLQPVEQNWSEQDQMQSHWRSLQHQSVPAQTHFVLISKYNELHKRYRDLEHQHNNCQRRIETAAMKYREAKEKVKEWKKYIDREQLQKQKSLTELHNNHALVDHHDGAAMGQYHGVGGDNLPQPLETSKIEQPGPSVPPAKTLCSVGIVSDSHVEERACPDTFINSQFSLTSSGQTTDVDYGAPNLEFSPEECRLGNNGTVVVSSKLLRRKDKPSSGAMLPPGRIKQESNYFEQPIEIKSDHFSSPMASQRPPICAENSDLDLLAEPINTPRKLRRAFDTRERAKSRERMAGVLAVNPLFPTSSEVPGSQTPSYPQKESAPSINHLETSLNFHAPAAMPNSQTHKVLQPVSPNVLAKRGKRASSSVCKRKRSDCDTTSDVATLAEIGGAEVTPKKIPQNSGTDTPENDASRRLDALFHKTSPEARLLVRAHAPVSVASEPIGSLSFAPAQNYKTTADSSVLSKEQHVGTPVEPVSVKLKPEMCAPEPTRKAKRLQYVKDSVLPLQPNDQPLRLRPLSSLRLEDFKINPMYAGADFAFKDSFRGKEQRRCLPGCTRPECCGTFIKAVEMGVRATNKSDAEVLESYLGERWQQIMGTFPRSKRDEIIIQAHATALAKDHGKHRQAFERRSTPPGYWRTDMPSTQEAAEDRARAEEMVRQKVEERWREAIRGDQRWRMPNTADAYGCSCLIF